MVISRYKVYLAFYSGSLSRNNCMRQRSAHVLPSPAPRNHVWKPSGTTKIFITIQHSISTHTGIGVKNMNALNPGKMNRVSIWSCEARTEFILRLSPLHPNPSPRQTMKGHRHSDLNSTTKGAESQTSRKEKTLRVLQWR